MHSKLTTETLGLDVGAHYYKTAEIGDGASGLVPVWHPWEFRNPVNLKETRNPEISRELSQEAAGIKGPCFVGGDSDCQSALTFLPIFAHI